MKESNKVLIGIGIGIIAGSMAGYFLASEEGQEFQRKTKKQLKQLEGDMKKSIKTNSDMVNEKLNAVTTSAKGWADEMSKTVKQKISSTTSAAEDAVEEVTEDFQSGAAKARRNISNKVASSNSNISNA